MSVTVLAVPEQAQAAHGCVAEVQFGYDGFAAHERDQCSIVAWVLAAGRVGNPDRKGLSSEPERLIDPVAAAESWAGGVALYVRGQRAVRRASRNRATSLSSLK